MKIIEDYYKENFDKLVKSYKYRAGSVQNAEDIIQQAFMYAYKYKKKYDPKQPFERWFSVILRNTFVDYMADVRLDGMTKDIDTCLNEVEPTGHDQITPFARKAINQLIKDQSKAIQTVLLPYFNEGYSITDIHILTGASKSFITKSVKNLIVQLER
jgi:RNA polymerase sigma factor (sigma-70 family)